MGCRTGFAADLNGRYEVTMFVGMWFDRQVYDRDRCEVGHKTTGSLARCEASLMFSVSPTKDEDTCTKDEGQCQLHLLSSADSTLLG